MLSFVNALQEELRKKYKHMPYKFKSNLSTICNLAFEVFTALDSLFLSLPVSDASSL